MPNTQPVRCTTPGCTSEDFYGKHVSLESVDFQRDHDGKITTAWAGDWDLSHVLEIRCAEGHLILGEQPSLRAPGDVSDAMEAALIKAEFIKELNEEKAS